MRAITVAVVLLTAIAAESAGARHHDPAKPCRASEVGALVVRFIDAFNAGDLQRLDRTFARRPYFRWYATSAPGERLFPVARDRAGLLAYFAERHAAGERLTLTRLRVTGNTIASGRGWKTYGNFEYRVTREAADLAPTAYHGKGALHCYASRLDQLIVRAMAPAA